MTPLIRLLSGIVLMAALGFTAPVSHSYRLSNGLTVILSPQDDVQAACVLTYHVTGERDNPREFKGAFYLYQFLMFLGTENVNPYDRVMFVRRNGGRSSGRVHYDRSIFYQVIPDHKLDHALWLESERLKSLRLTDRDINGQKEILARRINRFSESSVTFRAREWVRSRVFENTAYETPLYGDIDKLKYLNNDLIRRVYNMFRDPDHVILVITGRFDGSRTQQLINRYFSPLQPLPVDSQPRYTVSSPRRSYVNKNWLIDGLEENFVMVGIRAPSRLRHDHVFFELIRYYLLDERLSQLDNTMNRVNSLDVSINHEYTAHVESNALLIRIGAKNRINLEKAKYILEKEFEALQKYPLANAELKLIKSVMKLDLKKRLFRLEERAELLAESYHLTGSLDYDRVFSERIDGISQYDIMETGRKYLGKSNLVILNVYRK